MHFSRPELCYLNIVPAHVAKSVNVQKRTGQMQKKSLKLLQKQNLQNRDTFHPEKCDPDMKMFNEERFVQMVQRARRKTQSSQGKSQQESMYLGHLTHTRMQQLNDYSRPAVARPILAMLDCLEKTILAAKPGLL